MDFTDKIYSALIAAAVSLSVALISFIANRKSLTAEREKFERQLRRGLTEKLYESRMKCYPKAMEITEGLRNSKMKEQGKNLNEKYFKNILGKIDLWHCTEAAFLLSSTAMNRFYDIRALLRTKPDQNGRYSEKHLRDINEAKNSFRSALRKDIKLLFEEEIKDWEVPKPLSKRSIDGKM